MEVLNLVSVVIHIKKLKKMIIRISVDWSPHRQLFTTFQAVNSRVSPPGGIFTRNPTTVPPPPSQAGVIDFNCAVTGCGPQCREVTALGGGGGAPRTPGPHG